MMTLHYGVKYKPVTDKKVSTVGYSDADWAGCKATRRSTSGYIFLMNGCPVAWASKKQSLVSLSSTESEYIALAKCVQQAIWMASWMREVDLDVGGPMDLLVDNLGTIALSETTKGHDLAKHIDIRYFFIRDAVKEGQVSIYTVASSQNLADIMTKSLPREKHRRIVTALGLDWWYHDSRGSVKC